MKTTARDFISGAIAVLAAVLGGAAADAQSYPTRPITVIIPFAGGSASDVVTRIMLDRMSKSMGQPIIVDNRPGAGGNTGTAAATKAARTATRCSPSAPDRSRPTRCFIAISAMIRIRTSSRSRRSRTSPSSWWRAPICRSSR